MAYTYCKNGHFVGCSYCETDEDNCPLCELQALVVEIREEYAEGCNCCGRLHPVPEAIERAEKFLADNPPKTPEELAPKKEVLCWCRAKKRPHEYRTFEYMGLKPCPKEPVPQS